MNSLPCRSICACRLVRIALRIAATFAVLALHATANAEIAGKPRIVDGNTIEIAGQRIRLYGVDAPDERQTCNADGREWRCGQEAGFALARIIETHWTYCYERDRDLRVVVAVCHLSGPNGPDLSAAMVREGWALADRQYATDYVAAEDEARKARAGLWRGEFAAPWDWRQRNR